MIDYTAWRFWFDALQLVGTVAVGVYVWWSNRAKVNAKRFKALEDQVATRMSKSVHQVGEDKRDNSCAEHKKKTGELEMALNRLGTEVRNMPSRQEMAALSHDITGLTQQIGRLEGRLEGLNRVADLINEFLINQGAKR
jgi:hypothetical protein